LTKARFVAEAACAAEEHPFAERADARRDPVFDPLMRFEVVATLTDETTENNSMRQSSASSSRKRTCS
jgi:hypothetical protein